MITYSNSDLFLSPGQALVNTVNTVGVMGKGIAKDFKSIYPEMFMEYQAACESGTFSIGSLLYYRSRNKVVVNLPTKRHWRGPSRVEYVETGLQAFVASYRSEGVTSVAFPQLGCGNGELDWESEVRPLMVQYLGPLPIPVYIHIYSQTNPVEHRDVGSMKQWLRQEPRSLGFIEFWEDLTKAIGDPNTPLKSNSIASIEGQSVAPIADDGSKLQDIDQEDWLDLWNELRTAGFVTIGELGFPFRGVEQNVLSILSELPYIAPVNVASRTNHADEPVTDMFGRIDSHGIQLLPNAIEARVSVTPQIINIHPLQTALFNGL